MLVGSLALLVRWMTERGGAPDVGDGVPGAPALPPVAESPTSPRGSLTLEGLPAGEATPNTEAAAWTLDVRVLGLPADAKPPTYVEVMPVSTGGDREDLEIQAIEDETPAHIRFDVTDVVRAGATRLRVRVRHADAFPGSTVVEVPSGSNARERGGILAAEVTVKAAAVLEGRVVGPNGQPVAHAAVCVDGMEFRMDADRSTDFDPEVDVRLLEAGDMTGPDGRFRVLAHGAERVVLVAGWAAEGAPTVSPPIAITVGRAQEVGDLVLGRLEHLRGRVRGPELNEGRRTPVRAARLGEQRELFEGLMRTPSGAAQGRLEVRIDADGGFDLGGADDAVWRVTAEGDDGGAEQSHEVARRQRTLVRGPSEGVTLDVRRTMLTVRVADEQGPLNGAWVLVQGPDALVCRTFDGGHARVVLLPATTYDVVAWGWDHGVERRRITTGAPGTVAQVECTLPVTPTPRPPEMAWVPTGPANPTLVVSAQGWDGALLPAVLRVRDERGAEVPVTWIEQGRGVTWLVKDVLPALADAWLTSRLSPGSYRLEVEAPLHRTELVPFEIGENGRATDRIELRLTPR